MLTYDDIPRLFNVASYFVDRNVEEGRGQRPSLVCPERTYTYAELAARVNSVGHVLRELGVRREQRVLIALNDGIEFVATWYAVLKIGAVVADVYTFLPPKDYEYYLRYSAAEVAVVDGVTLERMRNAATAIPWDVRLLVVGVPEAQLRGGEHSFEALTAQAPDQLEPAPTSKDEIAIWKYTTGSTGTPKAAVHCAHDPLFCFDWYARRVLGYREDDLVLPVPKLFFGYARDATALFTFGVGAAGVVFPERSTPERIFEFTDRHRPTILVQVPTMMMPSTTHQSSQTLVMHACLSVT